MRSARVIAVIFTGLLIFISRFDSHLLAQTPETPPPDFFVEAEVDNHRPYLGQQITYTVKRYQAAEFPNRPHYEDHPFTGLWHTPLIQRPSYTTTVAGREYLVHPTHIALFPNLTGPLIIDPTRLTIPGNSPDTDTTLYSEAININVRPLPEGAPPHFQGAVGQFEINAKFSSDEVEVNHPVTLIVVIKGSGNIQTMPYPTLPESDLWIPADMFGFGEATDNIPLSKDTVKGSRQIEWPMIPTKEGQLFYPVIRFSYFDPQTATYHSLRTDPIPVTVLPDASASIFESPLPEVRQQVKRLAGDIRHIKPVPGNLAPNADTTEMARPALFWSCALLPVLTVGSAWFWQSRRQAAHTPLARRRGARRVAKNTLTSARQQPNPYPTIRHALTGYLSDKLDQSVSGLTSDQLFDLLNDVRLNPQLTERLQMLLARIEAEQFAPVPDKQAASRSLIVTARILIDDLEKFFSRRGM